MRQRCVIIENLTQCPPISHLRRLGLRLTRRLNVPRKRDKTVINAKSLRLLLCSANGHCHCPQQWQGSKELDEGWNGSLLLQWDRSAASVSMFLRCVCVSENRLCNRIINQPHYLCPYFVFSCFHVSSAITVSLKKEKKKAQSKKFTEKTISQSGSKRPYVRQGWNLLQPSTNTFCVFIMLSCNCCCIVEILRTDEESTEVSTL